MLDTMSDLFFLLNDFTTRVVESLNPSGVTISSLYLVVFSLLDDLDVLYMIKLSCNFLPGIASVFSRETKVAISINRISCDVILVLFSSK